MRKGGNLMKKFVPAISIVLFPYTIVFCLYCIFSGFLMESVFQNNAYLFLLILIIIWVVALVCAISICAVSLVEKWNFIELSRTNMLIKTVSIPAYLVIFVISAACMITIFGFALSIILMIFDMMSIVLSGLIGISAVKRSYDSKAISANEMILYGVLQFVFCADVATSMIVFYKSKKVSRVDKNSPYAIIRE